MAELKKINPESGWLEFKLIADALLQPPVLRCKLRPSSDLENVDLYSEGVLKPSEGTVRRALAAIIAWDLTDGDKPVPCTAEEKALRYQSFRLLMAQVTEGGSYLGSEILTAAKNLENFLGN
jgi:hypothetical protein